MDTDEAENTSPKGYLVTGGDLDNQIGSSIALNLSGWEEDTTDDLSNIVSLLCLMKRFFNLSPSNVDIPNTEWTNISTALSRTVAVTVDQGFLDCPTPNGKSGLDIIQSSIASYVPQSKTIGSSYRRGVRSICPVPAG